MHHFGTEHFDAYIRLMHISVVAQLRPIKVFFGRITIKYECFRE